MAETPDWGLEDSVRGGGSVATDGSSKPRGTSVFFVGGCGLYWGPADSRNDSGPGGNQTAPRAEIYAVARALAVVRNPITFFSDNALVVKKLNAMLRSQQVKGRHQKDWGQIRKNLHKLAAADWLKAHLEPEEATGAAEAGCYPHW